MLEPTSGNSVELLTFMKKVGVSRVVRVRSYALQPCGRSREKRLDYGGDAPRQEAGSAGPSTSRPPAAMLETNIELSVTHLELPK